MGNAIENIVKKITPSPVKKELRDDGLRNFYHEDFVLSVIQDGKEYSGVYVAGNELHEFFKNLNIPTIKAKVTVRMIKDGKSYETKIFPFEMKRIIQNKVAKQILIRKLVANLK